VVAAFSSIALNNEKLDVVMIFSEGLKFLVGVLCDNRQRGIAGSGAISTVVYEYC
jgi:hypothetical protein